MTSSSVLDFSDTLHRAKQKLAFVVSALQIERPDSPGDLLSREGATEGLGVILSEVLDTVSDANVMIERAMPRRNGVPTTAGISPGFD